MNLRKRNMKQESPVSNNDQEEIVVKKVPKEENDNSVKRSNKGGELNDSKEENEEPENDEESEDDDSPPCPEVRKLLQSEKTTTGELFDYYENELLLAGESAEERKEIDEHPERPIITMRTTAVSNIMHGLIAGWIKEIKQLRMKEPNVVFRKLFTLWFAVFRDDHWICDTDSPDVVYSLIKELGNMWKNVFQKSNEVLKITDSLRKELKVIFEYHAEEVKTLSECWEHPIEFIYTSRKPKYKVDVFDLDEIAEIGQIVEERRLTMFASFDKELKMDEEKKKKQDGSSKSDEPPTKKKK